MDYKNIKTFEDACMALGIDPTKLPDVSMLPEKDQKALIAHYKLVIISRALNGGWEPNWKDQSEYKYFPWFCVRKDDEAPSGVGFSYDDCDNWGANTYVGSRLSFKTGPIARYAGEQFIDLYREYMLIEK